MNSQFSNVLKSKFWQDVLLLIVSFGIYFLYFHHVFLHLNTLLSSITGDALKNYYTFLFHVKNDQGLLHFEGMNFPYGEHVVYTDCQPLLAILLKLLPFTHPYLIGILHALMFGSFIITPLLLKRIFLRLNLPVPEAMMLSIGIALLSPQFAKINGGHHGLAYGCVIPYCTLLLLQYLQDRTTKPLVLLLVFNSLLFLLHPYIGFGLSVFSFVSIALLGIHRSTSHRSRVFLAALFTGVLPIVLFKLFMWVSDPHQNRTTEPYGNMALVENPSTILAPDFGPFQQALEFLLPAKVIHFEGHSYLGLMTILLGLTCLLLLPFKFRTLKIAPELLSLLVASFLLLMISFGYHSKLLSWLHVQSSSLNQFRAACRFAWFFYFICPIFLFAILYRNGMMREHQKGFKRFYTVICVLFLGMNVLEGHFYLKKDAAAFWKFRNFFNSSQLNASESRLIHSIDSLHAQVILPLPVFCVGSEMYDRVGGDNSMIPSMLLSYHCKLPVMSSWMSRTSMKETEHMLELLNPYKNDRPGLARLNTSPFLVLKTKDELLPDESRIDTKTRYFYTSDSLSLGVLNPDNLRNSATPADICDLNNSCDSTRVLYIHSLDKKPFTNANMMDYETMFVLDSNRLKPGKYAVSLRYYYTAMNYKSLACNLIVSRRKGADYAWHYNFPMSVFSGFYNGFSVLERRINIEQGCSYEFFIKGGLDNTYHISDFLLREESVNVGEFKQNERISTNNFPH